MFAQTISHDGVDLTNGNSQFSCDRCPAQFTRHSTLKDHYKRKHTNERSYACELCDKSFKTKDTLRFHKSTHASEPLKCSSCPRTFTRLSSLNRHRRTACRSRNVQGRQTSTPLSSSHQPQAGCAQLDTQAPECSEPITLEKMYLAQVLDYCSPFEPSKSTANQAIRGAIKAENWADLLSLRTSPASLQHEAWWIAAEEGSDGSLRVLARFVDVNVKADTTGNTALHVAAKKGYFSAADALLKSNASINCFNRFGQTPLTLAVLHEQAYLVQQLLTWDADPDIHAKASSGVPSPFARSLVLATSQILELILSKRSDLTFSSVMGVPLHHSTLSRTSNNFLLLVSKGADIEERGPYNETALHSACLHRSASCVQAILDRTNLSHSVDDAGRTCLHYLTWNNLPPEFAKLFIDRSPICFGICLRLLLEKGADVNALDDYGMSPLAYATNAIGYDMRNHHEGPIKRSCDEIRLLLDNGADPNIIDSGGYTVLDCFLSIADGPLFSELLKEGADTTLFSKAWNNFRRVADLLLEFGAMKAVAIRKSR